MKTRIRKKKKKLATTLKSFQNKEAQDTIKRKFRMDMFTVFKYYVGCHIREGLTYLE